MDCGLWGRKNAAGCSYCGIGPEECGGECFWMENTQACVPLESKIQQISFLLLKVYFQCIFSPPKNMTVSSGSKDLRNLCDLVYSGIWASWIFFDPTIIFLVKNRCILTTL